MSDDQTIMPFDFPVSPSITPSIIKVIGVGGGGSNAVNHMYREGIHDVTFVVCNTDHQALESSPVPVKIQLGSEGLGAGNKPERGRKAAEESLETVNKMLDDGCKMAFITAGMGGGTGTGAGPIIAKAARELGILTVGIVTIPFRFEGNRKIDKALDGVEEIGKYVDALLVINNERLREVYSNMSLMGGFAEADDTLSVAAKSIAEIITIKGEINLDFNDVRTVLKDGGVAIMSTGFGEGENRVNKAIESALNSPLLNNNDVFNSKKVLFNISYSNEKELLMEEMNEIHDFMIKFDRDVETKWGVYKDESLKGQVKFTILATGFGIKNVPGMEQKMTREDEKTIADLEDLEDKNQRRRDDFYGRGDSSYLPRKKKYYNYIFTEEDLDNDTLINEVEASPTYSRTRSQLERIQSKHKEEEKTVIIENDTDDMKIIF